MEEGTIDRRWKPTHVFSKRPISFKNFAVFPSLFQFAGFPHFVNSSVHFRYCVIQSALLLLRVLSDQFQNRNMLFMTDGITNGQSAIQPDIIQSNR